MAEEINRSSPGCTEEGNSKPTREEEGGGGDRAAEFDKNEEEEEEEQTRVSEVNSSDCAGGRKVSGDEGGELRISESETLTSSGLQSYYKESSEFLSEVPVEYSLQPLESVQDLKDEVTVVCEESSKGTTSGEVHMQNQSPELQGPSKLELPTSAEQSISATPTSAISQKELKPVDSGNSLCLTVQDKQDSPDTKPLPLVTVLKTPDGYNWRKYGQKQVKSPEGSRSYYRCTFSSCHAKKIECCDRSNHVIETVYRSPHNHDPPQKLNCTRENRSPSKLVPVNGTHEATPTGRGLNSPIPSTSFKESVVASDQTPETKQQDSCGSDETTEINVKEAYVEGPEFKRRQKRSSTEELSSHSKPGKKPKYVVHAAGDANISSDGYRWRKYGQKMVKGNPHPRNYYRCTSAGCPVRKHIERDVDNASAMVITYKGVHNHDIPVPRKRHGSNTTAPAVPLAIDNSQSSKTEPHQTSTQLSADKEEESSGETTKLGGEKSSEPARTLLSIGFEIKPC